MANLPANNKVEMHIASERYDVPEALTAVKTAELVIALHGRRDCNDAERAWMGGLDADSDEAAPLFRDDCAPGFRDDLAPLRLGSCWQ